MKPCRADLLGFETKIPAACWDYPPAYVRECNGDVELAANDLDTSWKQMFVVLYNGTSFNSAEIWITQQQAWCGI